MSRTQREKTKEKDRDGRAREDDDVDPFIVVEKEGTSEGARGPSRERAYSGYKANFLIDETLHCLLTLSRRNDPGWSVPEFPLTKTMPKKASVRLLSCQSPIKRLLLSRRIRTAVSLPGE